MINLVHVGVKLLDKHEKIGDWDITQWLPSPIVNDKGKVSVSKWFTAENELALCDELIDWLAKFIN